MHEIASRPARAAGVLRRRFTRSLLLLVACGGSGDPTEPEPPPSGIGTWATGAPVPAPPRTEAAAAALGGKIYLAGGIDQQTGATLASVQVYDPATNSWAEGVSLPAPRHHLTLTAAGGKLYAIGGFSDLAEPWPIESTVFVFDPTAGVWSEAAPLPEPTGAHAAVAVDGRVHVLGGARADAALVDHRVYDPASNAWSMVAPVPTAREHLGAAVIGTRIYAVGGRVESGGGFTNLAAVEVFDVAAGTWSPAAAMPTARSGHSVVAVGDRLYAIGGERIGGLFTENEELATATGVWRSVAPMPTPKSAMGAAVNGDVIHLLGGGAVAVAQLNYRFTP